MADKWRNMSVRGRPAGIGPKARRRGEVPFLQEETKEGCQPGARHVGGFRMDSERNCPVAPPSTIIQIA